MEIFSSRFYSLFISIFLVIGLFIAIRVIYNIVLKYKKEAVILKTNLYIFYFSISSLAILLINGFNVHKIIYTIIFMALFFSIVKILDTAINDIRKFESSEHKIPQIFRNVILVVLYVVGFFTIINVSMGVNLAPIFATSAVISMVIGLALQDTLTNFIAGIVLNMERFFKIGDNIKVNDVEGRVIEVTWRSTKIFCGGKGIVSIPNSIIVKQSTLNSSAIDNCLITFQIKTPHEIAPNFLTEVVIDTIFKHENIEKDPYPEVRLIGYESSFINYEGRVWTKKADLKKTIESELQKSIWYAFQRNGIKFPKTISEVHTPDEKDSIENLDEKIHLLRKVNFFNSFTDDILEKIASKIKIKIYGKNEYLFREGDSGDSFFIIYKGQVGIIIEDKIVAELKKGDFFGEMSLFTGKARTATVKTLEDSKFFVIDKNGFSDIIMTDKTIAETISEVIAKREFQNENIRKHNQEEIHERDRQEIKNKQKNIMDKIFKFFELQ